MNTAIAAPTTIKLPTHFSANFRRKNEQQNSGSRNTKPTLPTAERLPETVSAASVETAPPQISHTG